MFVRSLVALQLLLLPFAQAAFRQRSNNSSNSSNNQSPQPSGRQVRQPTQLAYEEYTVSPVNTSMGPSAIVAAQNLPNCDFSVLQSQKIIEQVADYLFNVSPECKIPPGESFETMTPARMKEIQMACLVAIKGRMEGSLFHGLQTSPQLIINAVRILHNLVDMKPDFCLVANELQIVLNGNHGGYNTPFGKMKVGTVSKHWLTDRQRYVTYRNGDVLNGSSQMANIFKRYHYRMEAIGTFQHPGTDAEVLNTLMGIAWADHIKFMAQLGTNPEMQVSNNIVKWQSMADGLVGVPTLKAHLTSLSLTQLLNLPANHPAFIESFDDRGPYGYSLLADAILPHFNSFLSGTHNLDFNLTNLATKFWEHLSISEEHRENSRLMMFKFLIAIHRVNQNQHFKIHVDTLFSTICKAKVSEIISDKVTREYSDLLSTMTEMPFSNLSRGIWAHPSIAKAMFDLRIKHLMTPLRPTEVLLSIFKDHYCFIRDPSVFDQWSNFLKMWLRDPRLTRDELQICSQMTRIIHGNLSGELATLLKWAETKFRRQGAQ